MDCSHVTEVSLNSSPPKPQTEQQNWQLRWNGSTLCSWPSSTCVHFITAAE
jgi:hypothetical protein